MWSNSAETSHVEITKQDSLITDAPMAHLYGTKGGTDTYHHERRPPRRFACTSAPAPDRSFL